MRRGVLAAVVSLVAVLPTPASAQAPQPFGDLSRRIAVGERVWVHERSGTKTSGPLTAVTAEGITLETADGERSFPRDAVSTVTVRRGYGRMGALIGAGAGAAIAIPYAVGSGGDPDAPVLTGLLGAGIGGIVGALIPRMKTVYRAPSETLRLTLAPDLSRRRCGMLLAARW